MATTIQQVTEALLRFDNLRAVLRAGIDYEQAMRAEKERDAALEALLDVLRRYVAECQP